ncbi:MAG: hypothetical protein HY042_10360 [Spirochaetia bacterium]|nr:hypothetical protein [Spirochaetia bacterium]
MILKRLIGYFRSRRETAVFELLESGILLENNVNVYWQPRLLILLRALIVAGAGGFIYTLHPHVADLLAASVSFFKFEAIFRFQTPDASFYHTLGRVLTAAVVLFYLAPALYVEFSACFAALAVDRAGSRAYVIRWHGWTREITTLFGDQISGLALQESPPGRLLGMGAIQLETHLNQTLRLPRLSRVRHAMRDLQAIRP